MVSVSAAQPIRIEPRPRLPSLRLTRLRRGPGNKSIECGPKLCTQDVSFYQNLMLRAIDHNDSGLSKAEANRTAAAVSVTRSAPAATISVVSVFPARTSNSSRRLIWRKAARVQRIRRPAQPQFGSRCDKSRNSQNWNFPPDRPSPWDPMWRPLWSPSLGGNDLEKRRHVLRRQSPSCSKDCPKSQGTSLGENVRIRINLLCFVRRPPQRSGGGAHHRRGTPGLVGRDDRPSLSLSAL